MMTTASSLHHLGLRFNEPNDWIVFNNGLILSNKLYYKNWHERIVFAFLVLLILRRFDRWNQQDTYTLFFLLSLFQGLSICTLFLQKKRAIILRLLFVQELIFKATSVYVTPKNSVKNVSVPIVQVDQNVNV